ncbi:Mpo1 family 2-hydroxy fatty acid dioxygenase [Janthinobacterium sp. 64]|uniref:Mpo1 family 2-hydroxy fatty acid dioxygenase n=1 Tax=Janthinobacterium sp. 64 TaxID=2035208 RepID=UPI000C2BC0F1|nr:Mpo1-like protein [Janthinobacterium sp. 64]PKB22269.1 putative membrane protein YGL010W [Janthinobacterium sp. 64]
MRTIDTLLAQYGESHRNHVNEWVHIVCVPLIVFSLLGLLWSAHPSVALLGSILALYYYYKLSRPFAAGMLLMLAAMLGLLQLMPALTILPVSLALFVLAWIGQFIGHQIEGKKPSFFDDVRFLLVGPLFVLGFLYRRLRLAY